MVISLKLIHLTFFMDHSSISLIEAVLPVPVTRHELDRRAVITAFTECQWLSDPTAKTPPYKGA